MKKLFFMMLAVCTLASCSKDGGGEGNSNITVPDQSQLTQTAYADNMSGQSGVTFTTTGAWTSSIAESTTTRAVTPNWITIDPASGNAAGNYTINITLSQNFTGAKRTATITILCNGTPIKITVNQDRKTQGGVVPSQPSGSGTLTNESGQTVNLVGMQHEIYDPEVVRISFISETKIVDGKEQNEVFMANFYNPLQDGRLKTGTYPVRDIISSLPEVTGGRCEWYKSSLGVYGDGGTVKVEYADQAYTFTFDIKTLTGHTITGSFKGVPTYLNQEVKVTSIALNESHKTLEFGRSFALNATIMPENATDKRHTWSSGNTAVATVDENGYVTTVAAGKATITVTSTEGNKTATCEVTVASAISVQSITVDPTEITIFKGDSYDNINVTILPENASNKSYDFTYDNAGIATYSEKGVVFSQEVGTTTITLTTKDGAKTAKLKVNVIARPASGSGTIKTSNSTGLLYQKSIIKVDHTVIAADEVQLDFRNDENIAVSTLSFYNLLTNGRLTPGTYTVSDLYGITGTNRYGKVKSPTWIHPNEEGYEGQAIGLMYYYESGTVSVTVSGDTYTIKFNDVKTNSTRGFESETITGSYTGKLTDVNEYYSVTSVQLDKSTLSLDLGSGAQLMATVNPTNAFNKNVTWSSSNSNIVSLGDNGSVYAISVGTAIITVTTEDGAKTAACTVTVKPLPATGSGTFSNTSSQSIDIKRAAYQINGKEPKEIYFTFYSESTSSGELGFTLSRESTDTGALKAGTYSAIYYLYATKLGVKSSSTNTGTVTVAVNGGQYTITLNITTETGVKITGTYTGTLLEM